jgi:hypothetical protein
MTKDKDPVDISERREHRAEILQKYSEPIDGLIDTFEAGWRAVWADECKRRGKTIPFEEWFYITDENGDCPFEIAGMGIKHQQKE